MLGKPLTDRPGDPMYPRERIHPVRPDRDSDIGTNRVAAPPLAVAFGPITSPGCDAHRS